MNEIYNNTISGRRNQSEWLVGIEQTGFMVAVSVHRRQTFAVKQIPVNVLGIFSLQIKNAQQ